MIEQIDCPNHKFERCYVINEMVFWECPTCKAGEYENFCDMNDEGWAWLKTYYKSGNDEVV